MRGPHGCGGSGEQGRSQVLPKDNGRHLTKEGMMALAEMEDLVEELRELLELLKFQSSGPQRRFLQKRIWLILNQLGEETYV